METSGSSFLNNLVYPLIMSNLLAHQISSIANYKNPVLVVAGSKDSPVFPQKDPDIFVGTHGSILHAARFTRKTFKCGFISNALLCSKIIYCDTVRNLIGDTALDCLFVIDHIPRKLEDIAATSLLKVEANAVHRISQFDCTLLEFKYLWHEYFLSLVSILPLRKIVGFFLQIFTEKTSYLTRLSTGMFSVLYAYNLLPPNSVLQVVGIGLQLSGSYFFNHPTMMQKKGHYSQDLYIANKLTNQSLVEAKTIVFTDTDALQTLRDLNKTSLGQHIKLYISSIS